MLSNANVDDELLRLQQEQIERANQVEEVPAEDVKESIDEYVLSR